MSLHRCTVELDTMLQRTEALLCEKTQQVCELEEVSKIPASPDNQLENEHRLVMEASSNIVSLALENHTVDQTLTYYFNALIASSVQYTIDLTQPLHPNQFTLLLGKYTYHTHLVFANNGLFSGQSWPTRSN